MKKRESITHIMSSDLLTVNVTDHLNKVREMMEQNNIHHVPVVSGEQLKGMLSMTDIKRISFVNNYNSTDISTAMFDGLSIEQVMTKDLVTLQKSDYILDAAEILSKNEFHALPVLEDEKLVGIVTSTDLIKYLLDQY